MPGKCLASPREVPGKSQGTTREFPGTCLACSKPVPRKHRRYLWRARRVCDLEMPGTCLVHTKSVPVTYQVGARWVPGTQLVPAWSGPVSAGGRSI